MINSTEYEILKNLPNHKEDHTNPNIQLLIREKLIAYHITGCNAYATEYDGYDITPQGIRALEEYENTHAQAERETETLKTAKRANLQSTISLIIAGISVIVAIVALFIA